ncbi:MAG: isoprenylcysteine carboxylmethyltransferase family protein [Pseudomonadota bacterium]
MSAPELTALTAKLLQRFPPTAKTFLASVRERSRREVVRERAIAAVFGFFCHSIFAVAVGAMIVSMGFGMALGLGPFSGWAAVVANTLLIMQFTLGHSWLLSKSGRALLERLAPKGTGKTLMATTYGLVVSVQLLALYALWSPSGVVWFQAEGGWLIGILVAYACAWALLGLSIWNGGFELQSGLLGWLALWRGTKPQYPDMPTRGTFRIIRQPIYFSFALTPWLVPVWTPDQLGIAIALTAYCVIAPMNKEKRFAKTFGERWERYRARTPYFIPFWK